jgi:hypothetical protein
MVHSFAGASCWTSCSSIDLNVQWNENFINKKLTSIYCILLPKVLLMKPTKVVPSFLKDPNTAATPIAPQAPAPSSFFVAPAPGVSLFGKPSTVGAG